MSKQKIGAKERCIALCYVRQSFTRDASDTNSPDRQEENIRRICEQNGWTAEFYRDAEGHRSGRHEKNRPGWLSLKTRLSDLDIVAVVANDLSRLHRKGWRVGDLIDYLDERGVRLVLAAPGREIDMSSPMGRMLVQFIAMLDEWYSQDISQRAKDSAQHRKSKGITLGLPPFGTVRNDQGYLMPSTEGAWLLEDGTFAKGTLGDRLPNSIGWKSYYDAANRILNLYANGHSGIDKLTYIINDEGWAFRDRNGNPRPFKAEDVRRVVCNWMEYGGMVTGQRSKDRPAYEKMDFDSIEFPPDRAVFPVSLLKEVGKVRHERSLRPPDRSVKQISYPYPLSGMTYCAGCEIHATDADNPKLRTLLTGYMLMNGTRRYRHQPGIKCTSSNRSVPTDALDREFGRLLKHLTIAPEYLNEMSKMAIEADKAMRLTTEPSVDPEQEKQEAIALCKRKMEAAVTLFGDGMINREEYRRRIEENQREIAYWEARTSDSRKVALELAMCIEAVDKLARLWDASTDEDKRGLARSLFNELSFDLDTHRITSFKMKPWADRFITVRAALYEDDALTDENNEGSGGNLEEQAVLESNAVALKPDRGT